MQTRDLAQPLFRQIVGAPTHAWFIDGHTQWISGKNDEQAHEAAGNEEGQYNNNDEG
jgi:hypothetical protein